MPRKRLDTRLLGFKGEDLAEKILKEKGYKILQRNYYSKAGEIDLVALDGEILVFVEVKLRKNLKYGVPEEAVTKRKLERIRRTGNYYCIENKIKCSKMRIDVVSILLEGDELIRSKIIKVDKI